MLCPEEHVHSLMTLMATAEVCIKLGKLTIILLSSRFISMLAVACQEAEAFSALPRVISAGKDKVEQISETTVPPV